ncbi:MAG: class I SAM-dependent methyltransferase, partial [Pseudorhodobacter sp.]|nr:class I SAM-dependent methyltransferase [Frankiaceae bacterium]
MSNLVRPASPLQTRGLLDALRAARAGAVALPGLAPDTYARDHASFETLSDQRRLITDHLVALLARRQRGPVSVLSVGCGDGTLDTCLAATLADVAPTRPVRYVGIDPYAGSATAFSAAMTGLGRDSLTTEVHVATFDEAPVTGLFDIVTFVHSLYYVPRVAETLRAAFDLLGPGGELIVVNAPRGVLNALVGVLGPPLVGHRQWFSDDVV